LVAIYDPILAGIVRILNTHEQIVGTGFLISHSPEHHYGLVATSSRVIEQVTTFPIEQSLQETIPFIFHSDSSNTKWNGSIQSWSSSAREGVSILRIDGRLPKQVRSLPLNLATTPEGRRVTLFGYPTTHTGDFLGTWVYCDICRLGPKQVKTEYPFLQLDSPFITDGYSGAPVWDDARRRVIGLVTQVVNQDTQGNNGGYAYAAPIELLYRIYHDVQLKFSSPYHGLSPFSENDAASFFWLRSCN
jgi:Trypsin-like peptidase domain